jgi:hypothetical protein
MTELNILLCVMTNPWLFLYKPRENAREPYSIITTKDRGVAREHCITSKYTRISAHSRSQAELTLEPQFLFSKTYDVEITVVNH